MIQSAKIPAVIIISRILSADPCFVSYTHGLRFGELAGFVGVQDTKAISWLHLGLQNSSEAVPKVIKTSPARPNTRPSQNPASVIWSYLNFQGSLKCPFLLSSRINEDARKIGKDRWSLEMSWCLYQKPEIMRLANNNDHIYYSQ